jgi:hypothetical protein
MQWHDLLFHNSRVVLGAGSTVRQHTATGCTVCTVETVVTVVETAVVILATDLVLAVWHISIERRGTLSP